MPQYMQAAIVYEKLDDAVSLVRLYVEGRHWDEVSIDIQSKPFSPYDPHTGI